MCGILGLVQRPGRDGSPDLDSTLGVMLERLRHRGPDDEGRWVDRERGIGLGHTRLSVLDLSQLGHQPMISASGRYCITFNGEIYNFREIRAELEGLGLAFRGGSDTEVLLGALDAWGIDDTLPRLTGMFSFAVWDAEARVLHLARDRAGEKPLFYGWIDGDFALASELKALRVHPRWDRSIDRDSLALYMRYAYVPAPYSIYRGIYKLFPGTCLTLTRDQLRGKADFSPWPQDAGPGPSPTSYWSMMETARLGIESGKGGARERTAELDSLLRSAVRQQMVADVPLGAFLSGGIDSSVVVALMQAQSMDAVRTFTIGFDVPGFNEAEHAKRVAEHLGTDHTELYVSASEAMEVLPSLPLVYDEPHADSSHIPTILVSRLARRDVTVSLSGDGGDELFCGYNRYVHSQRVWNGIRFLPFWLRGAVSRAVASIPPASWERGLSVFPGTVPRIGYKLHKLARGIPARTLTDLYRELISYWRDPERLVAGSLEPASFFGQEYLLEGGAGFLEQMLLWDLISYLPDDNLVKMDRASMSVGLETRAPLLDHRVVEFAWSLGRDLKLRGGESKWLLRQVLYQYVPRELIERPKMGFSVPVGAWLRDPLRDWGEALLDERRLRQQGILDPRLVRDAWEAHLTGRTEGQDALWAVLMFQAWHDCFEAS